MRAHNMHLLHTFPTRSTCSIRLSTEYLNWHWPQASAVTKKNDFDSGTVAQRVGKNKQAVAQVDIRYVSRHRDIQANRIMCIVSTMYIWKWSCGYSCQPTGRNRPARCSSQNVELCKQATLLRSMFSVATPRPRAYLLLWITNLIRILPDRGAPSEKRMPGKLSPCLDGESRVLVGYDLLWLLLLLTVYHYYCLCLLLAITVVGETYCCCWSVLVADEEFVGHPRWRHGPCIEAVRDLDSVAQFGLFTCRIAFQICPAGIVLEADLAVQIGAIGSCKLLELGNGHMNCARFEREEEIATESERHTV